MKSKLIFFKGDRPAHKSSAEIFAENVNRRAGRKLISVISYADLVFNWHRGRLEVTLASGPTLLEDLGTTFYLRDYRGYHSERYALARYLQAKGREVYNSDLLQNETLSKLEQMTSWSFEGMPLPRSLFLNRRHISLVTDKIEFPLVVKSINAAGGQLNYLVGSKKELAAAAAEIGEKLLVQEYIDNDGDYRVGIMYGKPVIEYKRSRTKSSKSHLNNVSQGASRKLVDEKDVRDLAIKAAKSLGREFCGVDIMRQLGTKKLFLLECNFNDGTRILGDGVEDVYFKNATGLINSQ